MASKLLHFVLLTDSFIMLDAKPLKPRLSMQTETAYGARQFSGLSRNGPLGRVAQCPVSPNPGLTLNRAYELSMASNLRLGLIGVRTTRP